MAFSDSDIQGFKTGFYLGNRAPSETVSLSTKDCTFKNHMNVLFDVGTALVPQTFQFTGGQWGIAAVTPGTEKWQHVNAVFFTQVPDAESKYTIQFRDWNGEPSFNLYYEQQAESLGLTADQIDVAKAEAARLQIVGGLVIPVE